MFGIDKHVETAWVSPISMLSGGSEPRTHWMVLYNTGLLLAGVGQNQLFTFDENYEMTHGED